MSMWCSAVLQDKLPVQTPGHQRKYSIIIKYPNLPPAQQGERAAPHSMRAGGQEQSVQRYFTPLRSSPWQMA
eukprot:1136228-Pelagomonas_calceolata.AAC.1